MELRLQHEAYDVYHMNRRIGTVPASYNRTLLPTKYYFGHIAKIELSPNPIVTVEVRLI